MLGHVLRNDPREIYRMDVTDEGVSITVKALLVDDILQIVTRDEIISIFLGIKRKHVDDLVVFSIEFPYITFPNYAHKKLNWEALGVCGEQVSILLYILSMYFDKDVPESYFLSEDSQIMLIKTLYSKERDYHACPMELGFSEKIARKLAETFKKETLCVPAIKRASLTFLSLSSSTLRDFQKNKKEFEGLHGGLFGIMVKVRDSGVPQFSVPGNCACLGENPDTFSYSRDMSSHNLDTTLQQMTMLVAVVIFWNEMLRPLHEKMSV